MARVLITSGPTRQYLDPVRYLTNASSGLMGKCLAAAALDHGLEVVIVSGPVEIEYPAAATVHPVVSTEEMLEVSLELFKECDGAIGVAAPCDYRPKRVADQKLSKTGEPLVLHLLETPDVVASLGAVKETRWVVGFALETEDHRFRAITKLERKRCDLMVLNSPAAMNAIDTYVEVLDPAGEVVASLRGPKADVSAGIMNQIVERFVDIA